MREVTDQEIRSVSGGNGDPLRTLDIVHVTGYGPPIPQDELNFIMGLLGAGGGSSAEYLSAQYQGFGEGPGGGQVYDPSPDDGIYGLEVIPNPDGSFQVTVEQNGYFDVDGNGNFDAGEGPISAGTTYSTAPGWGAERENAINILNSFTPFPPQPLIS